MVHAPQLQPFYHFEDDKSLIFPAPNPVHLHHGEDIQTQVGFERMLKL